MEIKFAANFFRWRIYPLSLAQTRPTSLSAEPLRPDAEPRSSKILLEELARVRAKDLALIDKSDLSGVCLDFELPSIGYLTRFEWLWFIEMHLKRHQFQLGNMLKRVPQ